MGNIFFLTGCFLIGASIGGVILFLSIRTAKKRFNDTIENDKKLEKKASNEK